jgi:hypothetical protein
MTSPAAFTIWFICCAITMATLYVSFVLVGSHLGGSKRHRHG